MLMMKTLHLMIKPASSLCNMRCQYCFYRDVSEQRSVDSFGLMSLDTVDKMLENILSETDPGDAVSFVFQGGEPTLAGLPFFRAFVEKLSSWKNLRISLALQTNGLLLDEEWCAFLKEHRFLVGLSFDLLKEAQDGARRDATNRGTYARMLSALALLKRCSVDFNVLCTLTSFVARHPEAVWKQILALDLSYVQFTPCLGDFEGESPYALTPQRFSSFYTKLFSLWYADYQRGGRRSIKLFDDVVNLMVLGQPTLCGMDGNCRPQLIVEADGSVYPCDFYCLDEYRLGNITKNPVSELLSHPHVNAFCKRRTELSAACKDCPYLSFCGGGCPRMEKEIYVVGEYCGYREFLKECGTELYRLAERVRRSHRIQSIPTIKEKN